MLSVNFKVAVGYQYYTRAALAYEFTYPRLQNQFQDGDPY